MNIKCRASGLKPDAAGELYVFAAQQTPHDLSLTKPGFCSITG